MTSSMILVPMDEATVSRLLQCRKPGESLAAMFTRMVTAPTEPTKPLETPASLPPVSTLPGKHACEVLGVTVRANSLGELFGNIIDLFDSVAPELVQKFSQTGSSRRHYVSRDRQDVHIGRPDLPVVRTRSGWWVSKNVNRQQTVSQLRKLCKVAGLEWRRDIRISS